MNSRSKNLARAGRAYQLVSLSVLEMRFSSLGRPLNFSLLFALPFNASVNGAAITENRFVWHLVITRLYLRKHVFGFFVRGSRELWDSLNAWSRKGSCEDPDPRDAY
ncbi:hypothetical protein TNCV_1835551 [Trichonephila clavipes]|nr:hypothetical protein TNCV_1835551 [Trichonephila clavipes]